MLSFIFTFYPVDAVDIVDVDEIVSMIRFAVESNRFDRAMPRA
jgi:hypothetical protein